MRIHGDARRTGYFDVFPMLEVVEINAVRINKGQKAGDWHGHLHQADYWFVPSGLLRVGLASSDSLKGKTFTERLLRPGDDPLRIKRGLWHTYEALEETVLVYGLTQRWDGSDELRHPYIGVRGF